MQYHKRIESEVSYVNPGQNSHKCCDLLINSALEEANIKLVETGEHT